MCGRRDDSLLLDDMVDAVERLLEVGSHASGRQLESNRALAEQVQWNLLVLGEAAKRLRAETRARFANEVSWSDLARTRDRIVHHYEGINWLLISEIIRVELPALLTRLREIRDVLRDEFDLGDSLRPPRP